MLNGCSSLSDELVSRFTRILLNLQELDLSSCLHVTDTGLSAITSSLINLQLLRLSWCINITDKGLVGFAQSNPATVCSLEEKCPQRVKNEENLKMDTSQVCITAPLKNMQTLKFKAQPTKCVFSLLSIKFLGQSNFWQLLPASNYCRALLVS